MSTTFEYRVCQIQHSRVTFVDGKWQGGKPCDPEHSRDSLESCPDVYQFLQEAGVVGWELVSAVARFNRRVEAPGLLDQLFGDDDVSVTFYDTLYLKRIRSSDTVEA